MLTASRLFAMVRERGYRGSPDHFRHLVARHRPRRPAEAYLRLRSLPGEQAQVDWGHFGHLQIGRARRPLMAFVMVLSHSRQIFLRFFLDARMESFLRGHVGAFTAWGGVPRVLLYDNLKSAVLERRGDAIRFHPTLLAFAGQYRFEPRPSRSRAATRRGASSAPSATCAARSSPPAASPISTTSMLRPTTGAAASPPTGAARASRSARCARCSPRRRRACCRCPITPRRCSSASRSRSARRRMSASTCNDYSVPHTHVRRVLTVLADTHEVRIVDGAQVLACHRRSYDKGAQIEQDDHLQALVAHKRAARQHRATDRLAQVAPASQDLLLRAAERGANLGAITTGLMRLLDRYGAAELQVAIREALDRDVPHPNAVRLALERRREQRGEAPPVAVDLPADVQARDAPVQPHALEAYDQLKDVADE